MLNQQRERKSIALWQIVFLVVILVWALAAIGSQNATLTRDYNRTVEDAKKTLQERDKRIDGLETSEDKLNKEIKQLKKQLESKRKANLAQNPNTFTYVLKASEKDYWDYFIHRFGYANGRIMFAVCKSESGLNPTARNDGDIRFTGYPSLGLCQINGPTNWDWSNYKANIDKAYYVKFLNGGFWHWTDYKNGKYTKYLVNTI